MRVFYGFDSIPCFIRPVVTVGSYDGVHQGHRELIGRIVILAEQTSGESVVITFSPHPQSVLGNRGEPVELLNTLNEKILLLESLGIDNLIVVPFTCEFSRISSYDFVHDYLVNKVGVNNLVVGYDHHFGHNNEGDFDYLSRLQSKFGFQILEIPEQEVERHKVSSTVIRRLIRRGDMAEASHLLGYHYFLIAKRNEEFGTEEQGKLLPPEGKYGVKIYRIGCLPSCETFMEIASLDIFPDKSMNMDPKPMVEDRFIVEFR